MSLSRRLRPPPPSPEARAREAQAAAALAAQRGRQSLPPAPRAAKAVAAVLRPFRAQTGLGLSELKRRWDEIAGAPYAGKTRPEKLAGGVLTLFAPAALAPFLQQQSPLLIERLRLAGAKITQVRLEHRALVRRPANVRALQKRLAEADEAALAQALDRVGDADLKSALMRLGRAVKQG